jgi:hypothetical protein
MLTSYKRRGGTRSKTPPKLIAIDLTKGENRNHPDIKLNKDYLVLYNGTFYAGQFGREWYGLNFQAIYDAGCQYDKPGTNSSLWQAIWEIQYIKPRLKKPKRKINKCACGSEISLDSETCGECSCEEDGV